jgi:hypothetical protein
MRSSGDVERDMMRANEIVELRIQFSVICGGILICEK